MGKIETVKLASDNPPNVWELVVSISMGVVVKMGLKTRELVQNVLKMYLDP